MTELSETMKGLAAKMQAPRPQSSIDWGKQKKTGSEFKYPPTVAPYLPKEAVAMAQVHERQGQAAFVKAYERAVNPLVCGNCQGIGFVMLVLTKAGPLSSPSPSGVLTWFDGDEHHGRGWYVIDKTLCYDCPECKGVAR
jgi:hypothetical protein